MVQIVLPETCAGKFAARSFAAARPSGYNKVGVCNLGSALIVINDQAEGLCNHCI